MAKSKQTQLPLRFLKPEEMRLRSKEGLPVVLEAGQNNSFEHLNEVILEHKNELLDQIYQHGRLLIRGYSVKEPEQFEKIIFSLGFDPIFNPLDDRYYHAYTKYATPPAKAPANSPILPHNELCARLIRPQFIGFFCMEEDQEGAGETTLVSMKDVYQNMSEDLLETLKEPVEFRHYFYKDRLEFLKSKGIDYTSIEAMLHENQMDFEWVNQKDLKLIAKVRIPAIVTHPVTHEKNLAISTFNATPEFYRDFWRRFKPRNWRERFVRSFFKLFLNYMLEQYIKKAVHPVYQFNQANIRELCDLLWNHANLFTWRRGDVLIIDNIQVAHGRMPASKGRKLANINMNLADFSEFS